MVECRCRRRAIVDTQKSSLAVCHLCERDTVGFDDRFRPACREHGGTSDIESVVDVASRVTGGLSEDRPAVDQEHVPSLDSSNTVDEWSRIPVSPGPADSHLEPRSFDSGIPSADPVSTKAVIVSPQTDISVYLGTEPDGPAEDSHSLPHVRQSAVVSQTPGRSTPTQTRPRSVRRPLPSQAQRRGDG